jgi:hypothetical protein
MVNSVHHEGSQTARIIGRVYEAFDPVEYPSDGKITAGDSLEAREIAHVYEGKDWRDLDTRFLAANCIQSIFFLSFQAYRFFLPAFLTAAVKDYSRAPEIVDNLVSTLLDPVTAQKLYHPTSNSEDVVDMYTFVCRMDSLTCAQVEAVVEVLRFLSNYHLADFPYDEPQRALDGYWLERLRKEKTGT